MSGFLYFLPTDMKAASHALMERHGCAHAINGDKGVNSLHTYAGPGGAAGLLVTINGDWPDNYALGHRPDDQIWRKGPSTWVEGKELTYWVGYEKAHKPTPADLERDRVYQGTAVKLLDGNAWIIPYCHVHVPERPELRSTLPERIDLAEDGETLIARPHPRFAELSAGAFAFWQMYVLMPDAPKLTGKDQIALAVGGLGVNYRIGKVESIALLGLWSHDEFGLVSRAMIGADELDAWVASAPEVPDSKKTDPASPAGGSSTSSSGNAAMTSAASSS